jgi:hypothetical protein
MQNRLQIQQFPTQLVAIALAAAATVAGAGALGYSLRPLSTVSGPTRVVEVQAQPAPDTADCVRIAPQGHKAC